MIPADEVRLASAIAKYTVGSGASGNSPQTLGLPYVGTVFRWSPEAFPAALGR